MSANSVEGELEYFVPAADKNCKIWYKVVGDLNSGIPPLLTLHCGPGQDHSYLHPLSHFATRYNKSVIFFDQIGGGKSTHLQEKNGDEGFWTEEFFMEQIDRLLDHLSVGEYDLIGHSWGGMLGARYAVRLGSTPASSKHKLRRLIILSSPASLKLWMEAQDALRAQLPEDVQAVLKKHEEAGTQHSQEFAEAVKIFYKENVCRLEHWPAELIASFATMEADPTVNHTMLGKYEFQVTGSLRDWSIVDELHKINVPTLVLNGAYDGARDLACEPFWQKIPNVQKFTFLNSSHSAYIEEPELFKKVVKDFLFN